MQRLKARLQTPFFHGLAGGLIVAVLGAIALGTGLIEAEAGSDAAASTPVASAPPLSEPVAEGDALTAGEIYERVAPAVAFIEAEGVAGPAGSGSGFVFDDSGHILTNAHVVAGAERVTVKLGEDGDELEAEIVGADTSTDVAVLAVDSSELDAPPVVAADSDEVTVGEPVVAIGNPFGLDRTVTTGIVSALQREITAPDGFTISDVIQTDAAINPGNSGGPLLNSVGEVIGINSQIATGGSNGSVGVGFAVPINTATGVAAEILEDGSADHAFIGISGADLEPEIAEALNLEVDRGVLVQSVQPESPAAEAGLEAGDVIVSLGGRELRAGGDVIVAVDGEPVRGMDDVVAAVNRAEPGEKLELTLQRDDGPEDVELTLGERPGGDRG